MVVRAALDQMAARPGIPDRVRLDALRELHGARRVTGEILDSNYRRTNVWGTTNPASRLARLND